MEENIEELYIEFFYCLFKGKLVESRFSNFQEYKDFKEEAITAHRNDPFFRKIYDLNKEFIYKSFEVRGPFE